MLDIKFIQENQELVQKAADKKRLDFKVIDLMYADDKRLKLLTEVEQMRADQNKTNEIIVKITDAPRRVQLIEDMKLLKARLANKENELLEAMKVWRRLMLLVPNVPDVSVPDGENDADNVEVRRWGELPNFSFPPLDHATLMTKLGWVDLERGVRAAGFRGYYLKNEAVRWSFALWQLGLNYLLSQGFTPLMVPSLLNKPAFIGTGYLPQGEDDLYQTQDGAYLAGTGEVGAMSYLMDEILAAEELPKKFVAFSPCFRREAGSHGKDTKGLIRVHEFFKLEQIVLDEASHEKSVAHHEMLTAYAEALLQQLELPYRVVVNCGGDLGLGQVKKYDLEVWLPSEKRYLETHSSSYFHDFQARRLNIRYRDSEGKLRFAHSLNNTALATPRLLAALVENYQQADGTVATPRALAPYLTLAPITSRDEEAGLAN